MSTVNPIAKQGLLSGIRLAMLHQATPQPVIDGVRRSAKPGGYADSCADIAFSLKPFLPIVTPVNPPEPARDLDWSWPDTQQGIQDAVAAGANTLWMNVSLFSAHPCIKLLPTLIEKNIHFIGNDPRMVEAYDDKARCNKYLFSCEELQGHVQEHTILTRPFSWDQVPSQTSYPVILKPIRGRGSQGVTLVKSRDELERAANSLLEEDNRIMLEPFMEGEEITVAVMPPSADRLKHWSLPIVTRFDQIDGVMPYNGKVAVTLNSRAVSQEQFDADDEYQKVSRLCEIAADKLKALTVIRIDCRRVNDTTDRQFKLFDVNPKPNANCSGRPGREDQESLVVMAAKEYGWDAQTMLSYLAAARKPYSVLAA